MVWLDICDEQGNAIYLDVHRVERKRVDRRWRHAVSGICGNGLFEVEVLVEPGGEGEVTYLDLGERSSFGRQLMNGIDARCLETGLIDAARRHCGLQGRFNESTVIAP